MISGSGKFYLVFMFLTLAFIVPTKSWAKTFKIQRYIQLTDGSKILNDLKDFEFLELSGFGAPSYAMKDIRAKSTHYFMTETHYLEKRVPGDICSGEMLTKNVCLLHPYPNSTVLARESARVAKGKAVFVHTLLVDRKVSHNDSEIRRLANFLESIR